MIALLLGIFVSALAPLDSEAEIAKAWAAYEGGEKLLNSKLSSKALWTESAKKDLLLSYLSAAKSFRYPSLAPILVEHLDYDAVGPGNEKRKVSLGERFPAFDALSSYNVQVVPELLATIKRTDSSSAPDKDLKIYLSIVAMRKVYGGGKVGLELAKKRIELEIETAKGKEKELLEK